VLLAASMRPYVSGTQMTLWLAESKIKGPSAGIKKFDRKSAIFDLHFLPDELIQTRFSNFPAAIRRGVNSMIVEANGFTVVPRRQNQVKIAAMEPEHNTSVRFLKFGAFSTHLPHAGETPPIQSELGRYGVSLVRVSSQSSW
jgi:hypothetical protein